MSTCKLNGPKYPKIPFSESLFDSEMGFQGDLWLFILLLLTDRQCPVSRATYSKCEILGLNHPHHPTGAKDKQCMLLKGLTPV